MAEEQQPHTITLKPGEVYMDLDAQTCSMQVIALPNLIRFQVDDATMERMVADWLVAHPETLDKLVKVHRAAKRKKNER